MQTLGAFDAKTHFSALLDKVEKGEEILIIKHGKPVAKLCPIGFSKADLKGAIEGIQKFQSSRKLTLGVDWKTLRDEGEDKWLLIRCFYRAFLVLLG